MTYWEVVHREGCRCAGCRHRIVLEVGALTQEADGHFRGCPRLGKCHCPANAPRDEWRPTDEA